MRLLPVDFECAALSADPTGRLASDPAGAGASGRRNGKMD